MPRKLRTLAPDTTYHVTSRGNEKQPIARDEADWLVLAVPPNPVEWLYNDLKAAGVKVTRVGDCLAPRRAHAAVVDGERAGTSI